MKPTLQPLSADNQPKTAAPLSPAARTAWTTSFAVQAPKTMPSERLKARAELVRTALSSTQY